MPGSKIQFEIRRNGNASSIESTEIILFCHPMFVLTYSTLFKPMRLCLLVRIASWIDIAFKPMPRCLSSRSAP